MRLGPCGWLLPASQAAGAALTGIGRVVFENLLHDVPQRVGYALTAPDALLAWIEGERDGRLRRVEFPYRRAKCAGS